MVPTDPRASIGRMIQGELGPDRIRELREVDDYRNVFYVGFDWASIVIAAAASLVVASPWAYLIAVLWIGSRQRALINLVHQASHRQLFASESLNLWVGRLFCAFPLLMCLGPYQSHHLQHHSHLWDDQKDPKNEWYEVMDLRTGAMNPLWFAGMSLSRLGIHTAMNLRDALKWHVASRSELVAISLFWTAVVVGFALPGALSVLALYWLVPYLTVFQLIRYVTTASDHAGLQSPNPWLATRTWNAGPVARWLIAPHSDSYHLAHHLVPSVPHYRLAELHRALMQVPEYAAGHHCDGLIVPRRADAPSVLSDICHPERISRYKRMPASFIGMPTASSS